MNATVAAVSEDVQIWLDRKGLSISKYGTVRMVKAVSTDLRSPSYPSDAIVYEPGTTVIAEDYDTAPRCGHGLHFSATAREASASAGGSRFMVCDVDVESLVVIDHDKAKAAFCHVRFEGNETDFGLFA